MRNVQSFIKGNENRPYTTLATIPDPVNAGPEWYPNRSLRRARARALKRSK